MVNRNPPPPKGLLSETLFLPATGDYVASRHIPGTGITPIHIPGDAPNRGYIPTRHDVPEEFQVLREPLPHTGHTQIEQFWKNQFPGKTPEMVADTIRIRFAAAERLFYEDRGNAGERILNEGFELMKSMLADRSITDPIIKEYLLSLIVTGKDGAPGLLKIKEGPDKGKVPTYKDFRVLIGLDEPEFEKTLPEPRQP